MYVQKWGCGEAACGNMGEPWQNQRWIIPCLSASLTASQFSVTYAGETFLLPVHHIPVDSGQDLDLGSCNVHGGYHRQRGLYGRSLWGNIHQNFIRLHPYNDYSLGHTKYLRGSVLFFAQGRCQEKSCSDSLTWLRMRIKTYRITL